MSGERMNVNTKPASHGRLTELNPFDVQPAGKRSPARAESRQKGPVLNFAAEYGCVDWYQYSIPVDVTRRIH